MSTKNDYLYYPSKIGKLEYIKEPFPFYSPLRPPIHSQMSWKRVVYNTCVLTSYLSIYFGLDANFSPDTPTSIEIFLTRVDNYHSILKTFQYPMDLTSLQILTWLITAFLLKIWSFPDSNNATISRLSPILCVLLLLYGLFLRAFRLDVGF